MAVACRRTTTCRKGVACVKEPPRCYTGFLTSLPMIESNSLSYDWSMRRVCSLSLAYSAASVDV
jgi:hypothetical protein